MPVTVRCPNPACGKSFSADDGMLGRVTRCRHCGTGIVLRGGATVREKDTAPEATEELATPPSVGPLPRIGRFEIRARLGSGAFGTVYRAFDPQLDREVALKVPNPGVLNSLKRVERFLREARAAGNLRHPNIVPVYDTGRDGDTFYIASAFVDGRSLDEAVEERGMDFRRAARIARDLADAAAYAHGQGIVHRDIKPTNVILDEKDRPHLMDFGLAARAGQEKLTNDGAVMGTPAYMAPEQAAGKQGEAQPPADQYALGVLLYELLTGKVPFEGPVESVIVNKINSDPEPPRRHRPGVPRDLETVCLKAMARHPQDRYADCEALAEDLRRWLAGEQVRARRPGPAERFARWARKSPAVATLSAAVVLALAAGTVTASLFALKASREAERATQQEQNARAALKQAEDAAASERQANDQVRAEAERARQAQAAAETQKRLAEQKAEEARQAQAAAEAQRQRAEENAEKARQAQLAAETALAKAARADAQVSRESYVRLLAQAQEAISSQALVTPAARETAGALLARCGPEVRGWEWRLLSRMAAGQQREVRIKKEHPDDLADPKATLTGWSADGQYVVAVTQAGSVYEFDAAAGKVLHATHVSFNGQPELLAVGPSSTRRFAVATTPGVGTAKPADDNGWIEVFDLTRTTPALVLRQPFFGGPAADLAFSPDGNALAVAFLGPRGPNGERLPEAPALLATGRKREVTGFQSQLKLSRLRFTADGRAIMGIGCANGKWLLGSVDAASGKTLQTFATGERPLAFALAQKDRLLFADHQGQVHSLDLAAGAPEKVAVRMNRPAWLSVSPDGKRVGVAAAGRGALEVYDIASGERLLQCGGWLKNALISPDWRRVAVLDSLSLTVWDVPAE